MLAWSFFAGRFFDARADIDAPRPDALDGGQHVAGVKAARDHHFYRQAGGHGPIERQSGAAVSPSRGTIEQNRLHRILSQTRGIERVIDADRFPDAQIARAVGGLFVAVKLHDVELELRDDATDDRGIFIHEDSDLPDVRRAGRRARSDVAGST